MAHGIVTLHLAGLLTLVEAIECFTDMGRNLFVGFGDDRLSAERSIRNARDRFPEETLLVSEEAG